MVFNQSSILCLPRCSCLPPGKPHPEIAAFVSAMSEEFFAAMDDDLNVSKAMGAVYKFIKIVDPILNVIR